MQQTEYLLQKTWDLKLAQVVQGLRDRGYPNVQYHQFDGIHPREDNMPFGEYRYADEPWKAVPAKDVVDAIDARVRRRKLPQEVDICMGTEISEGGNAWISWTINHHYDLASEDNSTRCKMIPESQITHSRRRK